MILIEVLFQSIYMSLIDYFCIVSVLSDFLDFISFFQFFNQNILELISYALMDINMIYSNAGLTRIEKLPKQNP